MRGPLSRLHYKQRVSVPSVVDASCVIQASRANEHKAGTQGRKALSAPRPTQLRRRTLSPVSTDSPPTPNACANQQRYRSQSSASPHDPLAVTLTHVRSRSKERFTNP